MNVGHLRFFVLRLVQAFCKPLQDAEDSLRSLHGPFSRVHSTAILLQPATSSALQLIGNFSIQSQQCTTLVAGHSRIAVL